MRSKQCPCCKGTGLIETPFGERITDLRKANGMTQEQLAKIIGVSRPSMANIEAGRQSLTAETLIILARHFETTTDAILGT